MADTDDKSIVEEARARFEKAKSTYQCSRQLAIEDTKFALGDGDNGWQWPEAVLRSRRQIDSRPCLTVNVTAQHCNQIINNIRLNRPACRVLPVDNKADKKTAEILSGMIRNIQVISSADDAHDTAAEHGVYGGEGYWRIFTEYENPDSFNQIIKIGIVPNPQLVYVDPNAKELDKSDAEWGFIFEDISKEQCKREHPDFDPESWVQDKSGWTNEDTVRRAEYFYCTYHPDTLLMLADGSTVLKSEAPVGAMAVQERPTIIRKWKWCKLLGGVDSPVEERDWPGDYLPIISVVGKEVNIDGEIVRKGIVRDLKDAARMVNYAYSAAVETISLQNKVPYLAPIEAINGFDAIWKQANNENRAYLPYNAFDENGTPIPRPERQPASVLPSAQIEMLRLSTEEMRAASGQQNANFGIRSEAQSGVGIQRLKVQGEAATFHFPDNLARALRYEAKVLLDLIPKIYDTQRVVRILGLDGKDDQALLSPDMSQPYGEIENAEVKQIFNPTMGLYDVVIDTGPSYQTQRQEAADKMTELTTRNPALMQVAGDIIMRSYDFPMAEQLAERLERTIPPNLMEDKKEGQIPPQIQQQLQMLTQQNDEMQHMLQGAQFEMKKLEDERETKEKEIMVKAYEAETKRLQAVGQAMTPEQVQMIVFQTMQQVMSESNASMQVPFPEISEEWPTEVPMEHHEAPPMAPPIEQPEMSGPYMPEQG